MKKLLPLALLVIYSMAAQAQATFSIVTPPCNNNGIISVTFTGMTPPLTVNWITQGTAGTTIVHTGVSGLTDILTSYSGGPITVTATDTAGDVDTGSYYGDAPFTVCGSYILAGLCPAPDTIVDSICGGTAPYTYQWYNVSTSGIVGTANPLVAAGGNTYAVTVTDAAGCTYGGLVDPAGETFAYAVPNFTATVTADTANCTNGTASVSISTGAVPPLTYLWSTGATTPSIGSLVMGLYQCTVTDANGCTATGSGFVSQAINISVFVTPTPATCTSSNGAAIAFGSGGVPPYSYVWSNGATTQSQSGLGSGSYLVTVTDANGCIGYGGSYVSASTPIAVTYTTTPSLCTTPNGTVTLAPTGGTAPYSYSWYTYPPQSSITATGLTYGTYSFKVTDAAGCVQDGTVYIPPIDVLSATFLATPALCTLANGALTAYPAGGVTPYSYSWNTGSTTSGITSARAGDYTVTIMDALGCKITKYPYLPVNSPLGVGTVATPATCLYTSDGIDSAIAWGGTTPYSYAWSSGGTTASISALPTGPFWVTVTDAAGCVSTDYYSYVGYDTSNSSCYCTIEGTVYDDYNDNCTQDAGEPGIQNIQIHIVGGSVNVYTYTDASGYYSYKVPSGTYTVSETVLAYYPLQTCQTNNISVTTVAGTGCVNIVNFADSMDTIHDMQINTWDYTWPVIGNTYTQIVTITNNGTVSEDSVHVAYKPDGQILAPSFVPGGYFGGSPYYYTDTAVIPSVAPGATEVYLANYTVPADIPMNTRLVFQDTTVYKGADSTWIADYSPWNNVNYFTSTTVESFDPNFKEVSPAGTGPTGLIPYTDSILQYMIHFQNTGTWPAENVVIMDTLDANLNWTTLTPTFESGNCQITVTQTGSYKIAEFTFTDINLPTASSDPVRSNGLLSYSIHMKSGLAVGTQIRNKASIYFDYNAPVVTNATINTLSSSSIDTTTNHTGIANIGRAQKNTFTIYPNPAGSTFNAVINSAAATTGDIVITDVSGRMLVERPVTLQQGLQTIPEDVSSLASGVYVVSFSSNGNVQTQKLVIIKQ